MTEPAIGLHPGMTRAVYEAVDAANFSTLKLLDRSPAHAREAKLHPKAPTPALELGTHAHVAILEPARFELEYVAAPKFDRRTTAGKAGWAAFEAGNAGKTILSEDDYLWVCALRDAVWENPRAAALLKGPGHNEVGAVWTHERTGLLCKGLIDRVTVDDGWTFLLDVKTTPDASPWAFAASAAKYRYHAQAAMYLGGCNVISPRPRRFCWLVVEKEPPYAVAIYEPADAALIAGEQLCEKWLDLYAECRRTDVWPGYPLEIQTLELPRWATMEGE